jgi:D-arginine dehydrogenase
VWNCEPVPLRPGGVAEWLFRYHRRDKNVVHRLVIYAIPDAEEEPVTSADVAVIGGGMAGVSVAARLAGHCSVLLLEAEPQLAYHTTGRSAAIYLEAYGAAPVRALTRASRPLFDAVPELDPEAAPLLTPTQRLITADRATLPLLDAERAEVPSLVPLTPREALAYCPALDLDHLAGVLLETGAANIDVMGLHQHYVRTGRRRGMTVLTGARLLSGRWDGTAWQLDTAAGPVGAGVVVNAAGAWADPVAVALGARPLGMRPLRRTIAVARATGVDPSWPLIGDAAETFYCRPESGGLLVSPADETPSEPVDAAADELDVARAIERVNTALTLNLRSVVSTWAGLRTFSPDRVPVAGFDAELPGLVWLAGQGGYGIQLAPALAELAASLVLRQPADLPGVDPAALSPARF